MSEVKRYWIYKGNSNFCKELIPDDNCENMVRQKPEGFYDIVSTADIIEGGVEVVLASDYENLKEQLEKCESILKMYSESDYWTATQGDDQEYFKIDFYGDYLQGKRAREYFKEKEQK